MCSKKQAEKYYKYFSNLDGNKHIASLFAIQKILELIKINKPKNILEVGLGIGSISYSIIDYLRQQKTYFKYFGTEDNSFCLKALQSNLKNHYFDLMIYNDLEEINKNILFDFIIIDGSDTSLIKIPDLISKRGILFIEGDRKNQQESLINLFPNHKFVHSISNYKEPDYGPFITGHWSGGGKIIFVNPTYGQNLYWIKERVISSYRNRFVRNNI